jgi:hypothetical protein
MPSSGSCGFMINLPIPYGFNVGSNGNGTFTTGGGIFGTITFISTIVGTFTASVVNPIYDSSESPKIYKKIIFSSMTALSP